MKIFWSDNAQVIDTLRGVRPRTSAQIHLDAIALICRPSY